MTIKDIARESDFAVGTKICPHGIFFLSLHPLSIVL